MDLDGIISTKQTVNYESKRRAVDSNTPVSFSIRVREVELRFVRDGSVLRENLLKHRTIASPVIGLEIPPCFAEVMLLRPCLRQSYPPGFNRSSFLKSAKTPLRRRAKEVVVKYQPNQIVQSAYKILVLGVSSPSCAAATTIFTGIVFSCGWAASLHVLLVILSKIRSLLSRHNDEQPLNITGQLILRGQNGYFQSGQVKDRVTYVAHHTPFQAAEGFCYIYMGVSLARSYREVSGKTEYFHELVTEPAQPLEVLSEDLPVRCVMVLHEETWIHKGQGCLQKTPKPSALMVFSCYLFKYSYPSVSRVQILGSPTHTRHINSHKIGSPQQTPSWQRTPFQEGEACIITEQSLRRDFLKVLQKSFHQTSQSISPSTTRRPSLLIREAIKDPLLNALKPKYFYQVRKRRTSPESLTNTLLLHKEFGQNKSEAKKIAERSKSQSHQMQTVQSNIRWLTETELSAGPDTPLAAVLPAYPSFLS
uniref:Uncharacterized protein n=1 Tax=Brassica oleracea var. oleracea TaxID=109376 RepID=A0A0D3DN85_BRAOL